MLPLGVISAENSLCTFFVKKRINGRERERAALFCILPQPKSQHGLGLKIPAVLPVRTLCNGKKVSLQLRYQEETFPERLMKV